MMMAQSAIKQHMPRIQRRTLGPRTRTGSSKSSLVVGGGLEGGTTGALVVLVGGLEVGARGEDILVTRRI